MTTTKEKLGYGEWQKGRKLITDLQQRHGMSLTAISRAVKGDGDTPGWADSAREYRSQMTPKQYDRLVELNQQANGRTDLSDKNGKSQKGFDLQDRRLTDGEYERFVTMLRSVQLSQGEIGKIVGVSASMVSSYLAGRHRGTLRRLVALEEWMKTGTPERKAKGALKRPAKNAAETEPKPETAPAPQKVAETPETKPALARGEFETQLAAAQCLAAEMIDALEMLAVVTPAFARKGVDALLERATELHHDLRS